MTPDLEELGLHEGINEIILITTNHDGTPNAAPIGLHKQHSNLHIHLYPNKTRDNIEQTKHCTANITHDPLLIVTSALSNLPPQEYTTIQHNNQTHHILKKAEAWLLLKTTKQHNNTYTLQPVTGRTTKQAPQAINRGLNAVIEAAIHATRYVLYHNPQDLQHIQHYATITNKCGTPRDKKAMQTLHQLANINTQQHTNTNTETDK